MLQPRQLAPSWRRRPVVGRPMVAALLLLVATLVAPSAVSAQQYNGKCGVVFKRGENGKEEDVLQKFGIGLLEWASKCRWRVNCDSLSNIQDGNKWLLPANRHIYRFQTTFRLNAVLVFFRVVFNLLCINKGATLNVMIVTITMFDKHNLLTIYETHKCLIHFILI